MADKKVAKKTTSKKTNQMSVYEEKKPIKAKKPQNAGSSISVVCDGELVETEVSSSIYERAFNKNSEIVVKNKNKKKGYAPTVFAIILFSGLLLTNVWSQIKLDKVGDEVATMNRQLADLEAKEEEYTQKLAKKNEKALEEAADYIENELGMAKGDSSTTVYVELQLDDETVVIEKEENKNGWTTLLSSVGRFFSDLFD